GATSVVRGSGVSRGSAVALLSRSLVGLASPDARVSLAVLGPPAAHRSGRRDVRHDQVPLGVVPFLGDRLRLDLNLVAAGLVSHLPYSVPRTTAAPPPSSVPRSA